MERHHSRGFSLVELFIAVAVITLIISIGIPGITSFANAHKSSEVTGNIMSSLESARQAAVTGSTYVIVCPIREHTTHCSDDWTLPVSVFSDNNNNQLLDSGDEVLNTIHFTDVARYVIWDAFSEKPYIQFDDAGTSGNHSGRLHVCAISNSDINQEFIISAVGHTRVANNKERKNKC